MLDELFPDEQPDYFIAHRQKETIDSLKKGEIERVCISQKFPADSIALFGLREGFLKEGFKTFPDPRKKIEVPIDVILTAQILQRLNDEHSLLLAPYMLNNAELITELGYNVRVLEEGFNDKNKYPREAAFNGETLKHILLSVRPQSLEDWFNEKWRSIWDKNSPGRTKQYILDGTKILIPPHLSSKFEGSGYVKDDEGNEYYGYKIVWLYEIIDRKGVIVSMKIGPINDHDIKLGKELLKNFKFESGSTLIMDRGFVDGAWITHLKKDLGVDVFIPLKRNMEVTMGAISTADSRNLWQPHPTRVGQKIFEIKKGDLFWDECQVLESGVLVRWLRRDGKYDEVLFVTTKKDQTAQMILAVYDQRTEIEESHRQLKCFQGLETLPSKKLTHVVFRIIMGVIGYNLMNLFLNSEECETFEQYSLKTMRQRRPLDPNPKVIIYTHDSFAVLRNLEFLPLILRLKSAVREKLASIFENLSPHPTPV
jgi:hypothetical protein